MPLVEGRATEFPANANDESARNRAKKAKRDFEETISERYEIYRIPGQLYFREYL